MIGGAARAEGSGGKDACRAGAINHCCCPAGQRQASESLYARARLGLSQLAAATPAPLCRCRGLSTTRMPLLRGCDSESGPFVTPCDGRGNFNNTARNFSLRVMRFNVQLDRGAGSAKCPPPARKPRRRHSNQTWKAARRPRGKGLQGQPRRQSAPGRAAPAPVASSSSSCRRAVHCDLESDPGGDDVPVGHHFGSSDPSGQ